MSELMIAQQGAVVVLDGTRHRVRRGRTIAHREARIVRDYPHLWRPVTVDHPADPEPDPEPPKATAKATRSKTAKKATRKES